MNDSPTRRWLKALRSRHGLNQIDLANLIGVSRSAIGMYETGTDIPEDVLKAIQRALPDAGSPTRSETILDPALYMHTYPMVEMSYAGEVPCSTEWGDPLESDIPIEVDTKFAGRGRFVCKVVGDSCYPALHENDLTIWQADRRPPYGVIVIAQRRGDCGVTVKQLVRDPELQRDVLKPVNPRYDEPADGDGWDVTARLIGVIRKPDGPERTWFWVPGLRPRHLLTNEYD